MIPTGYPPPPNPSVDEFFPATPVVPAHTFELALGLGGTVSVGAYTAGVLYFLFEALDEWEKTKAAEGTDNRRSGSAKIRVPRHNMVIRVMTGTSGGGLNAVIAGKALTLRPRGANVFTPYRGKRHFPHRPEPRRN